MSPQFNIPKTQVAAIVETTDAPLKVVRDHPVKQASELEPGECLVELEYSGVCHTDLHARNGDWPIQAKLPLIGGHEGVGRIVAIGEHTQTSPVKVGDRVGIKWLAYSCLDCEPCRKGLEQSCLNGRYSGFTVDGTFSQYVVSWVTHVTPIPESLQSADAASILCAGVTVYRAIKYSNTHIGDWIVLPGAGGGLGHLAIQYAVAMGLRVVAVAPHADTGAEKKELCLKLGAEKWIDFRETKDLVKDIVDATDGLGAHAAVVTAANGQAYAQAIDYLRMGGTLMVVGLPARASLSADIFFTVTKSISIVGSYVGNRQDAREALDIAARGKVKVHFVLKPLSELSKTYEGLAEGTIVGRVVLNMKE
ncbi:GroES-like protein [Dichomitus squalens]|uniref:alcohol dehydrogenase n=2 Tax=Dichomitus squalens TaxID=114155 RepID=A0A4Q9NC21_9APHY|nr:GroES-like protein [Dichomitus squalens LYAD-421 SS1]EJF57406.1 GroES-like protein [Dichomitus squalens LYAD-421 SS1]TBU27007.1 GroES-like protein [Dichomitus squalens]TBU38474.1 GroES-like protein [Dichomitus squalens]TBU62682.1 GroES-like protein [Dichomitus squalens]